MRELKIKSETRGVGSYARQIYIKDEQGRTVAIFFPWNKQIAINPLTGYRKVEAYSTEEFWKEEEKL